MFNKIKIYLGVASVLFVSILGLTCYVPDYVFADDEVSFQNDKVADLKTDAAIYLNKGDIKNPQVLIGRFIKSFMFPMGFLALLWVVIAGIMYMTSAGNAERVQKSAKIILWVTLGMVAMVLSYAVVSILFKFLSS